MMTMTPYLAEETAYRREQLMRAWGHRETRRTPRNGRDAGPRRGRARVAPATADRTAVAVR